MYSPRWPGGGHKTPGRSVAPAAADGGYLVQEDGLVAVGHPRRREALMRPLRAASRVDLPQPLKCLDQAVGVIGQETGDARLDTLLGVCPFSPLPRGAALLSL